MSVSGRHLWGIPVILVILLVWNMMAVSAEPVPDLKGSWEAVSVDMYTPVGGFVNATGNQGTYHIITQDGLAVAGKETYYDSDSAANVTHFFPAVISPDGGTYFKDETGSGLSFGELVSDHEFYNYMFLADRGPMILVTHMLKTGTEPAPVKPVPTLIGEWNLTHNRNNGVSTTGLLTIKEQQGRIWSGTEQITDDNGTIIELPFAGTIGDTGRVYGVSSNEAYMAGSMAGEDIIDNALIIPGDTDGTFVVERWMTRNETAIQESNRAYPDITGDWKIDNRKVIQDGNITDEGPVSDEWMSYANQSGPFFTAIRHANDTSGLQNIESSGIFQTPDEAYLTNAASAFVQYHILNNSSIEAVVNRKDGKSILYVDVLTRKED